MLSFPERARRLFGASGQAPTLTIRRDSVKIRMFEFSSNPHSEIAAENFKLEMMFSDYESLQSSLSAVLSYNEVDRLNLEISLHDAHNPLPVSPCHALPR